MTALPLNGTQIFDHVPDGCRLHMLPDSMHAPWFRAGEWAVVDTTNTEIEWDQLYLVQQSNGPIIWQVCDWKARDNEPSQPCAYLHPLNRPQSWEETKAIIDATPPMGMIPIHLSDGPIHLDYLQEQIIGRVIGIYQQESLPLRHVPEVTGRPALARAKGGAA